MTQEEYKKAAEDVIFLSACAVNRIPPDPARVKRMDLTLLFQASDFHSLTAATAMALESAGIYDPAFTQAKSKAIRKAVLMDAEMQALFDRLNKEKIWYMPLKGCVLKDLYPSIGMRQMADRDILIDPSRTADVKDIMESLGFKTEFFGLGVHDTYHKEPVCSFEIHTSLFGTNHDEKLFRYYSDTEDRLISGPGYERRFTPEDFYLYMIAHEYKHYSVSGTGLRSLLDTYVYLQKTPLNMAYVTAETEKMGIADFENVNRSLAQHLFSGEDLTDSGRNMLNYILSSGVYGTVEHRVHNRMAQSGYGKLRYTLDRFFVPISKKNKNFHAMAGFFPFFYRHKILLPLLPFYRIIRGLKTGRLKAELKAINSHKK